MRIVMFYHSLISDWNHGNAHFLRGVVSDLKARGHDVRVYEPREAWSVQNLVQEGGEAALTGYQTAYPTLESIRYDPKHLDLREATQGADLVIVHEWNDHALVKALGTLRASQEKFRLLFHDTHHRSVTDQDSMAAYDLTHYDGVLAFGNVIRDLYIEKQWAKRAWTWHEAADTRVFRPIAGQECAGDLVWIGNWGDDERTAELHEFLLKPVKALGLRARVYGVRYPDAAKKALAEAGIEYRGWLPNYQAPEVFARYKVTVHVPRRPYTQALAGIPTIRIFEALACGIPLISAPWNDAEHLFTPGEDFAVASNGAQMQAQLAALLGNPAQARAQAARGLATIQQKHTCAHRVDELLEIAEELRAA